MGLIDIDTNLESRLSYQPILVSASSQLNRSHVLIATTMNSVVLDLLSIKAKTAKPTLKHIMTSLTLYKTMHKVSITYSIHQTSVSIVFLCCMLNRMYQTLELWIISENKIETCGEIRIKLGDAALF